MSAAKLDYWAGQADFQIKTMDAWLALAENRDDEAVRLMRTAAEAEEASDKHPVTPGNVAPSRELLGEMLLQLNRPAEAFAEFERSLKRDPESLPQHCRRGPRSGGFRQPHGRPQLLCTASGGCGRS